MWRLTDEEKAFVLGQYEPRNRLMEAKKRSKRLKIVKNNAKIAQKRAKK